MDLLPRKRKLSEFPTNVVSPRQQTYSKTTVEEENEYENLLKSQTDLQGKYPLPPETTVKLNETENKKADAISGKKSTQNEKLGTLNEKDAIDIVWFCTDYIEDIISHEMYKESLFILSTSFCRKFDVNPTGRDILIDWLISVQVHFKAENSTLHLAVALLDILLDTIHVPVNDLQGAAAATFFVAYKFIHRSISIRALLSLCIGSVTKEILEHYEILVLQTSNLIQAGGNLSVFFNYLLYKIFGSQFPAEIYYCGSYFIEIMLQQFVFIDCKAHEKAATAVYTSLSVFDYPQQLHPSYFFDFISKRKLQNVHGRLMRSLRLMYKNKSFLKNSSAYRKYKSSSRFIAEELLKGETLRRRKVSENV